jgi:hypothetical protein
MPIDLHELEYRLAGDRIGTWLWIANRDSGDWRTGRRWSQRSGSHPFVLVRDNDGGPTITTRPRSAHVSKGFHHQPHPPDCSPSCRIHRDGWIPPVLWTMAARHANATNYSCIEPYPDAMEFLRGEHG